MASMFCEHGLLDCKKCNHHVKTFTIRGETVSHGAYYVERCVQKNQRGDPAMVQVVERPDGSKEKCFWQPALPMEHNGDKTFAYCNTVREMEKKGAMLGKEWGAK